MEGFNFQRLNMYIKFIISLGLASIILYVNVHFSGDDPAKTLLFGFFLSLAIEYFLHDKYYKFSLFIPPICVLVYLMLSNHWFVLIAVPIELGFIGMLFSGLKIGEWLVEFKSNSGTKNT